MAATEPVAAVAIMASVESSTAWQTRVAPRAWMTGGENNAEKMPTP